MTKKEKRRLSTHFFINILLEPVLRLGRDDIDKKLIKQGFFQGMMNKFYILFEKNRFRSFLAKGGCPTPDKGHVFLKIEFFTPSLREATKKVLLLMAGPLRGGGGGVKGLAIKEK